MVVDTKQQRQRPYKMMAGGLAVFVMICLFLFSGCGTVAPDQPLSTGTGTPDISGPSTASSDSEIAAIQVIDAQSTLITYPGGYMTMTISTSPFAISSFVVSYGLSTPSKASGIIPRTTDAHGLASWRWQVEAGAHTGSWPLTISALLPNGSKTTKQIDVAITLAPIGVVSSQSILSASPKGNMTLTIMTAPQVSCRLLLNLGPGVPGKTIERKSDSNGIASWTWRVDGTATAGVWPLTISVTLMDRESSQKQVDITVL